MIMSQSSNENSNNPVNGNAEPSVVSKREKIRLKNQKKHQRQGEKRAHDLHERCCAFLLSAKLKQLSQPLLSMGFSAERATLALTENEGKLQESICWLLDGNKQAEDTSSSSSKLESGGNLKLDITEELAKIEELEIKYTCSKQDVERKVVAFEGNLVQAEQELLLRTQKKQEEEITVEEFTSNYSMQNKRNNSDDTPMATDLGSPESVNKNQQFPVKINDANAAGAAAEVEKIAPVVEKRSWAVPSSLVQLGQQQSGALVKSGQQQSGAALLREPVTVKSGQQQSGSLVKSGQQQRDAALVREPVMMMQQAESSIMMGGNQNLISGGGRCPNNNNSSNNNLISNPIAVLNLQTANLYHHHNEAIRNEVQYAIPTATSVTIPAASSLGLFKPSFARPFVSWKTGEEKMPSLEYDTVDWNFSKSNPKPPRPGGGGI